MANGTQLINDVNQLEIVLLVATSYPAKKAGTEIYVHILATNLSLLGHSVHLISIDKPKSLYTTRNDSEKKNYCHTQLENVKDLIPLLLAINPHFVHFHSLNYGSISINELKLVQQMGFRTIVTFHIAQTTCLSNDLWAFRTEPCNGLMNRDKCTLCLLSKHPNLPLGHRSIYFIQKIVYSFLGRFARLIPKITIASVSAHFSLVRSTVSRCSKIICLADWYYQVLLVNGFPPELILRVPQITLATLSPAMRTTNQRKNLVFVGRVNEEKGALDLLKAWEESLNSNLTLSIYGRVDSSSLVAESLNVVLARNENVYYHGEKEHDVLVKELSKFDILVLPSLFSEMSPLVISEAFTLGLHVLGSDSPGVKEACARGSHLLFKRGDIQGLAQIITNLNFNQQEFAEPTVSSNEFSAKQNAELHIRTYLQLLTGEA
jgi:glycosyltransferase involved in cell wall biosynthesis